MEARRLCRSEAEVRTLSFPAPQGIEAEAWQKCMSVLQQVADTPTLVSDQDRFKSLVAKIHREGQRGKRHQQREQRVVRDREAVLQTGLVQQQRGESSPARSATNVGRLTVQQPRSCYICKAKYTILHEYYHDLCPDCSELNWSKRTQRANLSGRYAVVTGGRIKIGYQVAVKLLRDGARVLVTTRFPADAAERFQAEVDAREWYPRLQIQGLDLRDLTQVEAFADGLQTQAQPLDILIHNAAQTVKRPLEFYRHLLEPRSVSADALKLLVDPRVATTLIEARPGYQGHLITSEGLFPARMFDRDGQQVDLRDQNSWLLKLGEISTIEMLETWLVNAASPFILTSRLRSLMSQSSFPRRFVINVSAMEGQFARVGKTSYHPHTNMAKAALNMLTRTSAADLARDFIYMNSVDTGWITDEKPFPLAEKVRQEHAFYTPLDIIDAASRIYDPIAMGINHEQQPLYGHFLKDYSPFPW